MFIKIERIVLILLASFLSACMGGPIVQQIASSIATKVADHAVANALDVQDGPSHKKQENIKLSDTEPDETWLMMATAAFQSPAQTTQAAEQEDSSADAEPPVQVLQANSLVRVRLYNLLIGDEKTAVLEKARRLGALNLPDKREWPRWYVATGVTEKDKKMITFIIPPEFGKLPSGTLAVVELTGPGELNVARYR